MQPPLGRAELVGAAREAADAFTAQRPLPKSVVELVGREFELRLPFGCPGMPQSPDGALSAEYGQADEALRARAVPVRWAPEEWLPKPESEAEAPFAAESIEGFWISRPWTLIEACPPASPAIAGGQPPSAPAEQTLAIAQFFTSDGSRVGRRDGKAYETVESIAPDALDLGRGLHLRLRGKIARVPGAGPAVCRGAAGLRPVCLLAATFDEVAIENPATGESLATWDASSQAPRTPSAR